MIYLIEDTFCSHDKWTMDKPVWAQNKVSRKMNQRSSQPKRNRKHLFPIR